MTEKVKTVIEFYFLLPDFKSRGHPRPGSLMLKKILVAYFEFSSSFTIFRATRALSQTVRCARLIVSQNIEALMSGSEA